MPGRGYSLEAKHTSNETRSSTSLREARQIPTPPPRCPAVALPKPPLLLLSSRDPRSVQAQGPEGAVRRRPLLLQKPGLGTWEDSGTALLSVLKEHSGDSTSAPEPHPNSQQRVQAQQAAPPLLTSRTP